jgi:hypothetical protein
VTYEPDGRYSVDRGEQNEIDKPFAERPASDRGQFWNVDHHLRGRWTGRGAMFGFNLAIFMHVFSALDWQAQHFGLGIGPTLVVKIAIATMLGAGLGFAAASIRRRITRED